MSWINNLRMWIKLAAVFTAISVVIGTSSLTTFRALSTIEATEMMTTHTYEVLEQLNEIVAGMVNSETGVRGYLVSGDIAFLAPLESGQKQYSAAVAKVGSLTSDNPVQQRRLETVKQNARAWLTEVAEREIALMKDPATQSKARELEASGAGKKTMDALRSVVQEMDREERSLLSVRAAAAEAAASYANMAMLLGGAATLILSIIGALSLTFAVTRPVQRMTREMTILAGGDTSVAISGVERRDEVGQMAQAIQVFKTNMIEVERLKAEQQETERRAAEQRKRDMLTIANGFEAAVGEIVETVSSASTELEAAAGTLTRTAESTQSLATRVASASEHASTNVQSVASATNEMASSVHEISRQVQESSRIAGEAVKQAEKTDSRINQLSQAANRIGDVIKLITAIAEQTNLLALNATIEAARAGEAGKGFAVVAQEVKALAAQTGKATGDISAQIAEMQAATQDSVSAIKEIGGTIGRIAEIAATIAAAVEEQGAATSEIARNVQQAASGTTEVASNIGEVDRGAAETGSASSQVLSSAQSLSSESNRLKLEVGKFLNTIRAA